MPEPWPFRWGGRTVLMGVVNVTPDSFSADGIYRDPGSAATHARALSEAGADVIDVGGESTRPGASLVSEEEEASRVLPAIAAIAGAVDLPISVDTTKPAVAEQALRMGATIVNDVSGSVNGAMFDVVRRHNGGLVLVHNGGRGAVDIVATVVRDLHEVATVARSAGVRRDDIVLDPGLGMGKGWQENLEILCGLQMVAALGYPVLVGASRKATISRVLGVPLEERLEGSLALAMTAVINGADMLRVHDVLESRRAVTVLDALVRGNRTVTD